MAEQDSAPGVDLYRVARIVGSYVRHHQIEPGQLVTLIAEVYRALSSLGQGAPPPIPEPRRPGVPIRRSVQRDYVVCLECGFRGTILRRHLQVQHGLSVADYRARWNLPPDHPITAPAYSERRSTIAKEREFGRRRRAPALPPAPRRRGRPPPARAE
jgi:predicted transcriptional regulator